MAGGYMGKTLFVDLSSGTIKEEVLEEKMCRDFIGSYTRLDYRLAYRDEQREAFILEVFREISIHGKHLTAIEPKPSYKLLFATIVLNPKYGYWETNSPPSPP